MPLIDASFGSYDRSTSPVTSVFGTLGAPPVEGYTHLRYFRYPNGEEHVYDIEADPGETKNIADEAPLEFLRSELVKGALGLGLDLRGFENPALGVNAMMAVDGSVIMAGGDGDNDYWAYGADAENIHERRNGGMDTLWYMAGPDLARAALPYRKARTVCRLRPCNEFNGRGTKRRRYDRRPPRQPQSISRPPNG